MNRTLLLALLVACAARDPYVFQLPSVCRDAADAAEAEACGARLLDDVMTGNLGIYDDPALARYVRRVGGRVAAQAGRDDVEWTFRILDDPGPQAWAAPGGYIYVTRGLLALLDTEAELAAVLAHEVAHVAAGHTDELFHRLGESWTPSLDLRALFRLARDDEAQADQLGVRYAAAAGYDPAALQRALRALHQPALQPEAPSWSDRHPPLDMRLAMSARVAANGEGRQGRSRYLDALEGLVVGQDPRRGLVHGGRFVHARAGVSFALPEGWQHEASWEPGQLRTQWFRARAPDERFSLYFIPLGGRLIGRGVETGMAGSETRATQVAGFDARVARIVEGASETISLDGAPEVHALLLTGRRGRRFALLVGTRFPEARPAVAAVFDTVVESARRVRESPVPVRRLQARTVGGGQTLAELVASGCAERADAELLRLLNTLEADTPTERETIKCVR